MNKSIKTRDQIESKYKWNIEAMYPDESQWEEDYKKAEKLGDEFLSFAGSLSESPEKMLEAFRSKDEIWQTVEKVYVYARMKSDEDTRIAKYLSMMDKSQALVARTAAKLSFFTPELLEISEEKLLDFVSKSEGLKLYEHVIRQILRQKAHVLSKAEERRHLKQSFSAGFLKIPNLQYNRQSFCKIYTSCYRYNQFNIHDYSSGCYPPA